MTDQLGMDYGTVEEEGNERGDERDGRGRRSNRFDRNLLKKLAEMLE